MRESLHPPWAVRDQPPKEALGASGCPSPALVWENNGEHWCDLGGGGQGDQSRQDLCSRRGVGEPLGGRLYHLPAGRTPAPSWTGSEPGSACAPSWPWTAPAGSIWGLEPPSLPLGQDVGRRVRNPKSRPLGQSVATSSCLRVLCLFASLLGLWSGKPLGMGGFPSGLSLSCPAPTWTGLNSGGSQ